MITENLTVLTGPTVLSDTNMLIMSNLLFQHVMSTFGRPVMVCVLMMVVMVICMTSASIKDRCKYDSGYSNCGDCCLRARYKCRTLCKTCNCDVHENNPDYMKYFYSKKCHRVCSWPTPAPSTKHGRELPRDVPAFLSAAAFPANYHRENTEQEFDEIQH